MKRKRIKVPKARMDGRGYVGVWNDGTIGWMMPKFISGGETDKRYPSTADYDDLKNYASGQRLFLCKVTITPIRDKKGRPITKIVPE